MVGNISGALMVPVDRQLILEAQRYITGANVHRLGEMMILYETAVRLHNCGHPAHVHYDYRYERRLRRFVFEERMKAFTQDSPPLSVSRITVNTSKRQITGLRPKHAG